MAARSREESVNGDIVESDDQLDTTFPNVFLQVSDETEATTARTVDELTKIKAATWRLAEQPNDPRPAWLQRYGGSWCTTES